MIVLFCYELGVLKRLVGLMGKHATTREQFGKP